MGFRRMPLRGNRFAALIAVFAVVLQALWPLLSHARPKDPTLLVPLCTIDGVTHYLELKSGKTPLDERSATHGEHCKLCVIGEGKIAAVSSSDVSAFPLVPSSDRSPVFLARKLSQPPHLLLAQPREPPAVS